ncbi:unnamed protein product [Mycena citricolor]|uniref:Cullin family profile domain-containing protein n=1 Tax=Mycena citricolor TaxID=2018698 RepID=A0AAD2Q5Z5_9AGAR|nr:unnamed protein product [Mycena citricolor]
MAGSVMQLLTLPRTGSAFAALSHDQPSSHTASSGVRSVKLNKIKVVWGEQPPRSIASPTLQQQIRRILDIEKSSGETIAYEGIYWDCHTLVCVQNKGEDLYNELKLELEKSISRLARGLLPKEAGTTSSAVSYISEFVASFEWIEKQVALLQSVLTYLDQVYVKQAQVLSIRLLAFSFIAKFIFANPQLNLALKESLKTLINADRDTSTHAEHLQTIHRLVSHLITHQQYIPFEKFYDETLREYYTAESVRLAEELKDEPKQFFAHIRTRIDEEAQRSQQLLSVESWKLMRDATTISLLTGRMSWIAQTTLQSCLEEKDFGTLKAMYELFVCASGTSVMCAAFKNDVQRVVSGIVKDAAADDRMVERLLEFRGSADSAVKTCFLDVVSSTPSTSDAARRPNREFVYALTDAFQLGFRARRNKPAEMIARHLDKLMRKGQGTMSDDEFDALLDSVLVLYRFTDDKDVFRGFYHRALSKRLLLQKSASSDFETKVLTKLKEQYDPEFSMGTDMFNDLHLSKDMVDKYHEKMNEGDIGLKLNAIVLKQGAWPFSQDEGSESITLPVEMMKQLTHFGQFYGRMHQNQKLVWKHSVATATLIGRFKAGNKELSVSLYQAVILLLFNGPEEWSFSDIKNETRLDDGVLRLTLQSLACGKKRVLTKIPLGKDIGDHDKFRFNDGFTDARAKIHINSIQAKVSDAESKQTNEMIHVERSHLLDAAIVRIMKAKKEMVYERLLSATIDAVKSRFAPEVKAIKTRIDDLMSREFVRRDDDNPQVLLYIA